jgi:hypothetical protein
VAELTIDSQAVGRKLPVSVNSWWHKRRSGDWGRYVAREVIPAVSRRFDADPRRVAIGGPSMGGFGAYHLALEYKGRFCAVGGHSAGLWVHDDEAFPRAFDDRADFERNDVVAAVRANPDAFGEIPVWNDYGKFRAGNAAFVAALRGGGAKLNADVCQEDSKSEPPLQLRRPSFGSVQLAHHPNDGERPAGARVHPQRDVPEQEVADKQRCGDPERCWPIRDAQQGRPLAIETSFFIAYEPSSN